MTNDDKAKQIGELVIRLREADAELAHQRELKSGVLRVCSACA